MSLKDFLLFLLLTVCTSCCYSITNTVISLVAHEQPGEMRDSSSKLKAHRANSQTISSHSVRFSTDTLFSF